MSALPDTLWIVQPNPLARDLRDFFLDLDAANRTAGTARFYRQKLEPFLDYAKSQGVVKSQDLTPSLMRRWLAHLGDGHNPGGVRAYWRATRAFCRFLVRDEILDKDPTASVRAQGGPGATAARGPRCHLGHARHLRQERERPAGPEHHAGPLEYGPACERSHRPERG